LLEESDDIGGNDRGSSDNSNTEKLLQMMKYDDEMANPFKAFESPAKAAKPHTHIGEGEDEQ
jgi:hypothetical protein